MNEKVPDVLVMDIDGKQYALSDLTEADKVRVNHIRDLENKLRLNEFEHEQLLHGRMAYIAELKNSLENPDGSKPE